MMMMIYERREIFMVVCSLCFFPSIREQKISFNTWLSHICLETSILCRRVILRNPRENRISYRREQNNDINKPQTTITFVGSKPGTLYKTTTSSITDFKSVVEVFLPLIEVWLLNNNKVSVTFEVIMTKRRNIAKFSFLSNFFPIRWLSVNNGVISPWCFLQDPPKL